MARMERLASARADDERHGRAHPRRGRDGSSRSAASTASATPTSPPSSRSPKPRACTTTSPARPSSGEALIERYADRFSERSRSSTRADGRAARSSTPTPRLYAGVLRENRSCLCGMLAAEYQTLPQPMRDAGARFFDDNESVARARARTGPRRRHRALRRSARDAARIVGGLEGAMLVARPYGDVERFQAAAANLLACDTRSRRADAVQPRPGHAPASLMGATGVGFAADSGPVETGW